jgi:hypothetical protein
MLRICHGLWWLDLLLILEDLLGDSSASGLRTVLSVELKAEAISRRSINVRPERDKIEVNFEVMTRQMHK